MPRSAILVGTSTPWQTSVSSGVIACTRTHGRWQILVETRGMKEHLELPRGWRVHGVITRVVFDGMAHELHAKRFPRVKDSGIDNLPA